MFKKFLAAKEEITKSEFLCYTTNGKKSDAKIHEPLLAKEVTDKYRSLSVARLRARTGGDLEFINSLVS